jgi:UDP-glucose 4-epimerase
MTRFLLTLGDAVKLVLYAYEHLRGGEICVRKAPSAKILTLGAIVAQEANKKFEYEVIGIFPGEKFHEILITEEEIARTQDCGDYFVVHPPWRKVKITKGIEKEYCSRDEIVSKAAVKELVQKSDKEFRDLGIQF